MWSLLHALCLAAYAVTPIVYAAVLFDRRTRRRSRAAGRRLLATLTAALLLGGGLATFFAAAANARPRFDQIALATLFFMTLLIALQGLSALTTRLLNAAARKEDNHEWTRSDTNESKRNHFERVQAWWRSTARPNSPRPTWLVSLAQLAVLILIGMPYGMAAVMTYRPKVRIIGTPTTQFGWPHREVTFKTDDGVPISAWWIPGATHGPHADRTVLLCHGLGANKLNQLHLARRLHDAGYNVLAIDLRAHGHSGGQFTSYGDRERRDVRAAVRFVKRTYPHHSRQIVGAGASLGAAALIAAAAETDQIDALVVYATYADLGQLAREVPDAHIPRPFNWLARAALPIASAHAGTDLAAFRPAEILAASRPRPIVILHGASDEIIPPHHGRQLHDAATGPRRLITPPTDHNGILDDEPAARDVADFLDAALAGPDRLVHAPG